MTYYCVDCIALTNDTELTEYRCRYADKPLEFQPETKTPCKRFQPQDYIEALNYDTR